MYKLYVLISVIIAAIAICCCAGSQLGNSDPNDAQAEVRSLVNELKAEDGSYNYQFETTNGIAAQESGVGGYYASGSSQFYTPEGQLIQLTYTADENGFQPQGEHLPTPPPIPEAILKSLEWNRAHPEEEQEGLYGGGNGGHGGAAQGYGPPQPQQQQQSGPYAKRI